MKRRNELIARTPRWPSCFACNRLRSAEQDLKPHRLDDRKSCPMPMRYTLPTHLSLRPKDCPANLPLGQLAMWHRMELAFKHRRCNATSSLWRQLAEHLLYTPHRSDTRIRAPSRKAQAVLPTELRINEPTARRITNRVPTSCSGTRERRPNSWSQHDSIETETATAALAMTNAEGRGRQHLDYIWLPPCQ